jgi:hypothetical protein
LQSSETRRSGTPTIIASGSAESDVEKVQFAVSANVTIEKGRGAARTGGLSRAGAGQSAGAANKPDETHRQAAHAALVEAQRTETSKQVRDVLARYLGEDTK